MSNETEFNEADVTGDFVQSRQNVVRRGHATGVRPFRPPQGPSPIVSGNGTTTHRPGNLNSSIFVKIENEKSFCVFDFCLFGVCT